MFLRADWQQWALGGPSFFRDMAFPFQVIEPKIDQARHYQARQKERSRTKGDLKHDGTHGSRGLQRPLQGTLAHLCGPS